MLKIYCQSDLLPTKSQDEQFIQKLKVLYKTINHIYFWIDPILYLISNQTTLPKATTTTLPVTFYRLVA